MSTSAIRFNPRNPARLARADGQLAFIRFDYTPAPKARVREPAPKARVREPAPKARVREPAAHIAFPYCDARWYSDRVTSYGATATQVLYKRGVHRAQFATTA